MSYPRSLLLISSRNSRVILIRSLTVCYAEFLCVLQIYLKYMNSNLSKYVDVVVGGQAGSEGKGAITAHLCRTNHYTGAIRCGGSNAGHTAYTEDGSEYIFQVLPVAGLVNPNVSLYVGAESFFMIEELEREIEVLESVWNQSQFDRIYVDPKASIVEERHKREESEKKLGESIGSTTHGIGAARVDTIWRSAGDMKLAEEYPEIEQAVSDKRVNDLVVDEELVILEGTQGTLLSMNQSDYYPKTTSQDCIASSFLSSAGLSPDSCRDVWCVFRTYPIRVAGDSGLLGGSEITFEDIKRRASLDEVPKEYTSVTGRERRIFEWSSDDFVKSYRLNAPNKIAITFLDYLSGEDYGVMKYSELSSTSRSFIEKIENQVDADVSVMKTGPLPNHIIDRN